MSRHSWKRIGIEVVFIFFISLTPLLWFRSGAVMLGHDNVAPLDPKIFLEGRMSTWTQQFYGQSQTLILGTVPIHLLDALPTLLGFSVQTSQKAVYIVWFFLIGLSAYALASVIRPRSSVFKLTATVFYQFNFFILQAWWIGEKSKFSAYIATPLLLATFLLVESGRLPVVIGTILGSFIIFLFNAGGLYGLPLYGGVFISIGCFIIFAIIESRVAKNWNVAKRVIVLAGSIFVLALAVNSYFYLPAIMKLRSGENQGLAQIGGISGVVSWASEISANASFTNLMRLEGIAEWYDNPEHPYAKAYLGNPVLIVFSFLWPLLAFLSLYTVKAPKLKRLVLYFFSVYLVGLFFAAGTHPPLGFLYQLLVEKIPGFFIFRSPYFKFAMSIFIANALLIAFFIDSLPTRLRRLVFVVVLVIVLVYHFPYFTGNFFEWRKGFSTRLTVPTYVYEFGGWLNEQTDEVRVLLLPPNSPDLQYGLYGWGYLSFQAVPTLLSNADVIVNNDRLNTEERILTLALYNAIARSDTSLVEKLLSVLSVSHVVVQHDTISTVVSGIPLERYIQGLKQTNLFTLEKRFGAWNVYRLSSKKIGTSFYLTTPIRVDGTFDDVDVFMPQLELPSNFVLKNAVPNALPAPAPAVIVPKCLTCSQKNKPIIVFPERNILPDDPFYALVLFFEHRRPPSTDPKSAIYDILGTTLKRVSEINELLFQQKVLTKEVVERYVQLLHAIEENFERLPTAQDKLDVASDVRHYLRAERNFLRPNIGRYVTGGSQTVLAGIVFSKIHRTEKFLEPFVAPLEEANGHLYQLNLDTQGTYQLLVKRDDILPFLSGKNDMHVLVDTVLRYDIKLSSVVDDRWISFGTVRLDAGTHTVRLVLPEIERISYALGSIQTEFSVREENSCFGTNITSVTHEKLYKIQLQYLNDFSDNLLLFLWETVGGQQRLLTAVKLLVSPLKEKTVQIVEVSPNATELTIGLCAPNLSQEYIGKQFTLQTSEVIDPKVTLRSTETKPADELPVTYKKESPTRYQVTLPSNMSYPTVLVFPQRFDPWWEIREIRARHIKVNGYANGWIIDKPIDNPLTVAYKGQLYLRWGAAVSAIVLLTGAMVLIKKVRRKSPTL